MSEEKIIFELRIPLYTKRINFLSLRMKKYILLFMVSLMLFSCGQKEIDQTINQEREVIAETDGQIETDVFIEGEQGSEMGDEESMDSMDDETEDMEDGAMYDGTYSAQLDQSIVTWEGAKIIGGGHEGIINVQSGEIQVENNEFVGGNLVIDMVTISATDVEGESKEGLDGHLKNEDFFDVENHPTASIEVTSANYVEGSDYEFSGNMTILDVTNPILFTGTVTPGTDTLTLQTAITIDKDDYGIGSGFKGAALRDEINLDIVASFKKN